MVWANFLASGWFVQLAHSCYLSKSAHCYFLSCYFFSYLPTVSFFPITLFILLPKWTVTFFPVSFFPTCPLLLSFLLLFFLLVHCYFLSCYFFSCYFFSYLKLLLSFLLPFFLLLSFRAPPWNHLNSYFIQSKFQQSCWTDIPSIKAWTKWLDILQIAFS